jgi:transcriptional regulator with XRE-family HTH domain
MSILKNKIDTILKEKGLNRHKLCQLTKIADSTLGDMVSERTPFSEYVKEKILPILEISQEEFENWIVADKYSKEILKLAIENKKDFPYKRKSMLTTKIDLILQKKGMSRTALSKEIKYSQSALNAIIIGKRGLSKSVLERISKALEIPQDEILSWVLADKYDLKVLEVSYSCNSNR